MLLYMSYCKYLNIQNILYSYPNMIQNILYIHLYILQSNLNILSIHYTLYILNIHLCKYSYIQSLHKSLSKNLHM